MTLDVSTQRTLLGFILLNIPPMNFKVHGSRLIGIGSPNIRGQTLGYYPFDRYKMCMLHCMALGCGNM